MTAADPGGEAARRRLAEIFGELLPESTGDDRDDRDGAATSGEERWYTENRPPHHDRG